MIRLLDEAARVQEFSDIQRTIFWMARHQPTAQSQPKATVLLGSKKPGFYLTTLALSSLDERHHQAVPMEKIRRSLMGTLQQIVPYILSASGAVFS